MDRHELHTAIDDAYARYQPLTDGQIATYIPELGKANPELFGIALATSSGRLFQVGDTDHPFSLQSISKPLMFGLALEKFGHEMVSRFVGVEPSGDAFNAISLQSDTHRPLNAMINAGAITITALLHAQFGDETFDMVLDRLSPFPPPPPPPPHYQAAGRQLVGSTTSVSESGAAHRTSRYVTGRSRTCCCVVLTGHRCTTRRPARMPSTSVGGYFRQCADDFRSASPRPGASFRG